MKRQIRFVNCSERNVAFIYKNTEREVFPHRIFFNISEESLARLVRVVNTRAKAGNGRVIATVEGWSYKS